MKDTNGRKYAKLSRLKAGDVVHTDDSLQYCCSPVTATLLDDNGRLYYECTAGRHYLDGQLQGHDNLVGIYPSSP